MFVVYKEPDMKKLCFDDHFSGHITNTSKSRKVWKLYGANLEKCGSYMEQVDLQTIIIIEEW